MSFVNYQAQQTLFAVRPSRLALQQLRLHTAGLRQLSINVWRNHAIEPVIALAYPYLAYGGCSVDFRLSDYDDTLMFGGHKPADIELLWLDSNRYLSNSPFDEWLDWLSDRIMKIRSTSLAPVILASWLNDTEHRTKLQSILDSIPAVYFADLDSICIETGVKLIDERTATMAGTAISNTAQSLLARKLACHWIPAAIFPPIKVVALDLDNTLHAGVLGEDGIDGVQLTTAHSAFQHFIKSLRQRGIFIALLSRNEKADVEALFRQRSDYPLRWDDFSATEISWDDKAVAINRVAGSLRVAANAILFVDDNPGELASVTEQLHGVHTVYSDPDASLTQRAVEYYPGLWRWKVGSDDIGRIEDMQVNAERDTLLTEMADPSDYFRNLQVTLLMRFDP